MPASALSPLGVMILALLREGDMHPYELKRLLLVRDGGRLVTITNGTLYRTVAQLADAGLVADRGVERDGRRPERTTYAVTEPGVAAVLDWVRHELPRAGRSREFRVALAEAHNLPRAEVAPLLRERRDRIAAEHTALAARLRSAADRGVPEQFLVELERDERLGAAELAWLDDLIARVETAAIGWGPDEIPAELAARIRAERKAASGA